MSVKYQMSGNRMRQAVYNRMADEWGLTYDLRLVKLLSRLCGRENAWGTLDALSEREREICEMLLSYNGYALFKMMLVKHGIEPHE